MAALSRENPRYGYRRVWALLLRREGWTVNKKRVQRLWREADLKVPAKKVRKRRRMGDPENATTRKRADHVNHVWSYRLRDGRHGGRQEIEGDAAVVDEYSRECLALEMERSITAEDVVVTLAGLFAQRGELGYHPRSDNAPEFIAAAVKRWLAASSVETLYIEPGAPWENAPTRRPSSAAYGTSYLTGRCLPI